ncbi:carbohydrate deacetylase isoform X2 [Clupea harengus]|nr:carbohydrate deacetylase isoform X2 [Clupea harengus]XP_042561646.1 carbohydrate deacetylase isoform X2 [Clupea harengus]XP_042561647.1 carbohydrate deacetylase isoform X2 [Clupea harengus]
MPQPKVKLVVTGDDFGYCPRRNHGIVECFQTGGVSNVSLLVNATSALDAAELAKIHLIPIGLHANLSEGAPVSQNLKGSTLLNEDGFFHGKTGFRKVLSSGQLNMYEVEQELRAQVKRFCELVGHLPYHMDGHQHVHVLPEVREVFAQVLADFGIRYTRIPVEPGLHACPLIPPHLHEFYIQVQKDALSSVEVFRRHGIRWPDVYLGLTTMGQNMSIDNIKQALGYALGARCLTNTLTTPLTGTQTDEIAAANRPVTVELMVHPGYPSHPQEGGCGQGPDDFSLSEDRQHELEILTDPSLLAYYKQESIQLCAFRDL